MTTVRAEEVRLPRYARDALARREEVIVLNRERPVFVIVHPDEHAAGASVRRGRPLREALAALGDAAAPDPAFVEDMEQVLASIGQAPGDPWAPS